MEPYYEMMLSVGTSLCPSVQFGSMSRERKVTENFTFDILPVTRLTENTDWGKTKTGQRSRSQGHKSPNKRQT